MSTSQQVVQTIARVDEITARLDRNAHARGLREAPAARGRSARILRLTALGMVLAMVMIVTALTGAVLGGIGALGLWSAIAIALVAVGLFVFWPREKPAVDYKEDMPTNAVVRRLGDILARKRNALPARAALQVDAISRQLPMLESQLGESDALDPLAQDARRLMGRHLPDLIERYERVPPAYRGERDSEGVTLDERLVQGLDAAKTALDDLARKLVRDDMDAFQTQGRFIESRYREENGPVQGD
ncbi:MAG: hypothetical protein QOD42_3514 [Sphingomonadales bacterium]|jgi:hypothetical protein|nr:hypothetical protein [Sphingomonadales bacterium]